MGATYFSTAPTPSGKNTSEAVSEHNKVPRPSNSACIVCGEDHFLQNCPVETIKEGKMFSLEEQGCFNCGVKGHRVEACYSQGRCKKCVPAKKSEKQSKHHSALCPLFEAMRLDGKRDTDTPGTRYKNSEDKRDTSNDANLGNSTSAPNERSTSRADYSPVPPRVAGGARLFHNTQHQGTCGGSRAPMKHEREDESSLASLSANDDRLERLLRSVETLSERVGNIERSSASVTQDVHI